MIRCCFRSANDDRERLQAAQVALLRVQIQVLIAVIGTLTGGRAPVLDDEQRRLVADAAASVGWKEAGKQLLICSLGTVRQWHRKLNKAPTIPRDPTTGAKRPVGRPRTAAWIERLICTMARRCPAWGYARIVGSLRAIGVVRSKSTVANILRRNRVPTSKTRLGASRQWKRWCAKHWTEMAALDFMTVHTWSFGGWKPTYVLVVIILATRRVHIAAVTQHPDQAVMQQVARNLTGLGGFLEQAGIQHLIHDNDQIFAMTGFDHIIATSGIRLVKIPPNAPNANAYAERVIQTLQRECTDRFHFVHTSSLRACLEQYLIYYHHHRPHQGLDNRIIDPGPEIGRAEGPVRMRSTLAETCCWRERAAA